MPPFDFLSRLFACLVALVLGAGGGSGAPAHAQAPTPDTLRLDAAVQQALDNNFQAQIARRQETVAENNYSVGNAGFLPRLTVDGGYDATVSNTTQQFIDQPEQTIDGATSENRTANASLRWTVFDGLGRLAAYDRLGAEAAQQEAATQEEVDVVVADVIESYYDVARQQRQLQVFREAVSISRERLRITQTRREVGTASDLAVRQARVDLNADSAEVLRQATELTNAKAELNRLLGRAESSTAYPVASSIEVDTSLAPEALRAAATSASPALRQAQQARQAAEAEQREVRSDWFPSVDLTAGYGYSQLDSESGFLQRQTSTDWTYGVSLTFDLFDGLNRWRRQQNAELRTANAETAVQDVRARLSTELSSAFEDYHNRLRLVSLQRDNLAVAADNVDLALQQFEVGTITSVELREVQEQRIRAESELLTAQFEAKQAEVELLRLSGQLQDRVQEGGAGP
ncbi:MAG: TolC family protein [Salinibacter sp.]